MNVEEAILARRSIRRFKDTPISDEQITSLLEAAMAAPSACNKRPWVFYVIKNKAMQDQLKTVSRYTYYDSPLMIIVCGNQKKRLSSRNDDFWIHDCSAAIENILLEAVELGLGSCWCGLHPMVTPVKRVKELLSLPEELLPLALIHIGYPDEEKEPRTQYDEKLIVTLE